MTDLQVDALLEKFDTLITLLTQALSQLNNVPDADTIALFQKGQLASLEQQFTKEVVNGWKTDIANK